jgi:exopolysaccharide biosynthesis polyprenyl glycosylphosphotransferase
MISTTLQRLKYIVTDFVTTNIAFCCFNICRFHLIGAEFGAGSASDYLLNTKLLWEQLLIPLLMMFVYWLSGYYNNPFVRSRIHSLIQTFTSSVINTAIIYLGLLVNETSIQKTEHYELVLVLFGLFLLVPYIGRYIITTYTFKMILTRKWQFNTIIVGNSKKARILADKLAKSQSIYGYHTVGFVKVAGETNVKDSHRIYTIPELPQAIADNHISQIVIALEDNDEKKVLSIVNQLFDLDVTLKVAVENFTHLSAAIRTADVYGEPMIDISTPTMSESSKNIKRFTDFVVSLVALLLLAIPFLFIALAIKLDSHGPIFYKQYRVGYRRKLFAIYKFRSMCKDAETTTPMLSSETDSRITKVGKFMRKYRIDELPQFWNVIKGDMALVGPRPERPYYINLIVKEAPYYTLLHQVRPGITSWGMVKFGYAQSVPEMVERSKYDLLYLSNMSLTMDLKILIFTIKTVITGKGI